MTSEQTAVAVYLTSLFNDADDMTAMMMMMRGSRWAAWEGAEVTSGILHSPLETMCGDLQLAHSPSGEEITCRRSDRHGDRFLSETQPSSCGGIPPLHQEARGGGGRLFLSEDRCGPLPLLCSSKRLLSYCWWHWAKHWLHCVLFYDIMSVLSAI